MNTLVDLFEQVCPTHNFGWKGSGDVGKGKCPFHDDRSPSLSIFKNESSDKSGWYCHSCGIGGTATEAVMKALNVSRKEANAWLVQQGYTVETELDKRTRLRTEAFERFLGYTNRLLREDTREGAKAVRAYLVSRGIPMSTWGQLAIGFYPTVDEVLAWLVENNIDEQYHQLLLPGNSDARNFCDGSVAFFYRSSFYAFSRVKVRNVVKEKNAKEKSIQWLGPPKKKAEKVGFFAPGKIPSRSDKAVAVEGEFDAILMWNLCEQNEAIYSFGGGGDLDSGISSLTSNGGTDEAIYVFPDNDGPGLKYLEDIVSEYTMVYVFQPSDYKEGEDPADWCRTHSLDDLSEAFENAIRGSDYAINKYVAALSRPSMDDEEKQRIQDNLIKYAQKLLPQQILVEKLVLATHELIGCTKDAMMGEIMGKDDGIVAIRMTANEFGTYVNKSKDKKKPVWEKVADVVVRGVKTIKEHMSPHSGNGDMIDSDSYGNTYFVFKVSKPGETHTVRILSGAAMDDKKFTEAIVKALGMVNVNRNNIGYIREAAFSNKVTERNSSSEHVEVIKKFCGWDRDFEKFYIPGGYIDIDGFHSSKETGVYVSINLEATRDSVSSDSVGIYKQFFLNPAPADMEFAKKLIRNDLINIYPHYVTLPLLAHAFTAPLLGLYNLDKFAFWLYGRTGKGKSTFATILASFYGNFWEKKNGNMGPITWNSTTYSIELIGKPLHNMLYLIDDFKTGRAAGQRGKMEEIRNVLQAYADNTGKYRRGEDTNINGLLLCTGEDLPLNESSLKGRSLVIQLGEGGNRFLAENFHANHCVHLPGIMAGFIQFLLKKKLTQSDVRNHILKWKQIVSKMLGGLDAESHSRTENNLTLNGCAWEYLAEYLGMEDLTPSYLEASARIGRYMSNFQEEDDPCQEFLSIIIDQISTGKCFLAGKAGNNSAIGETTRGSQVQIGEVHENYVILYNSIVQSMVNSAYRSVNGCDFPHSFRSLMSMMEDKKWLVKTGKDGGGKRRTIKVANNNRGCCLRRDLFNLNRVEEDDSLKVLAVNEELAVNEGSEGDAAEDN